MQYPHLWNRKLTRWCWQSLSSSLRPSMIMHNAQSRWTRFAIFKIFKAVHANLGRTLLHPMCIDAPTTILLKGNFQKMSADLATWQHQRSRPLATRPQFSEDFPFFSTPKISLTIHQSKKPLSLSHSQNGDRHREPPARREGRVSDFKFKSEFSSVSILLFPLFHCDCKLVRI